jgi:hypothetical protein
MIKLLTLAAFLASVHSAGARDCAAQHHRHSVGANSSSRSPPTLVHLTRQSRPMMPSLAVFAD